MFYIFSDPEIPEHKVDIEQPIPDHKFVYKDHEVQRGPKKGEMKKTVTLIIPPFLFRRKSDAKSIGKVAYFACNTCEQLDTQNTAFAMKYEDENGEPYYELIKAPIEHACNPGVTHHLVKVFRDKCYDAVAKDPTRPISHLYKDIREKMCSDLTDDEKKSFLDEIPKLISISAGLYNHRRNFIPKVDHPCDICEQTFCSISALKIHRAAKHNIREPRKKPMCDICGKTFKAVHLNRHMAKVHHIF